MRLCDKIAYICHDIDDAERAGLLTEADLPSEPREVLGRSSAERIATMVEDVVDASATAGDVTMSDVTRAALMDLRSFLYANLYHQGDAKSEEPKAERLVESLFDFFIEHFEEVPDEYRRHDDPHDIQVADYLASMTDRYAIRMYEELSVPRAWGLRRA